MEIIIEFKGVDRTDIAEPNSGINQVGGTHWGGGAHNSGFYFFTAQNPISRSIGAPPRLDELYIATMSCFTTHELGHALQ